MRKPSRAMIEHLRFVRDVTAGGLKCGGQPCVHHQNRVTREALARRGLLRVDDEGYVWATSAGEQALAKAAA